MGSSCQLSTFYSITRPGPDSDNGKCLPFDDRTGTTWLNHFGLIHHTPWYHLELVNIRWHHIPISSLVRVRSKMRSYKRPPTDPVTNWAPTVLRPSRTMISTPSRHCKRRPIPIWHQSCPYRRHRVDIAGVLVARVEGWVVVSMASRILSGAYEYWVLVELHYRRS